MQVGFLNNILLFRSSLSIAFTHWWFFFYLWYLQLVFATLVAWTLENIKIEKKSFFILCFLSGVLGLVLFCIAMVIFRVKPTPQIGYFIFLAGSVILISRKKILFNLISSVSLGFILFFIFIFLARMAFIQNLIVPSYADSVVHVQIVEDFLNPEQPPQAYFKLGATLKYYYHFGFHAITAWLCGITSTDSSQGILLLGQYFQVLCVLALYPLSQCLSNDNYSGWISMSVAGLFWSMPSHASNWGKYPAIFSMVGIAVTLQLILAYLNDKSFSPKKIWWLIFLACLSAILLHSRSIIMLLLVCSSYIFFTRSKILIPGLKIEADDTDNLPWLSILSSTIFLLLALIVFQLASHPILAIILLIVIVAAFFVDFIFASILLLILFTIIGDLPQLIGLLVIPERFNSLLDRPYILIFLYLPISLLSGKGFEIAQKFINRKNKIITIPAITFTVVILGFVNLLFFSNLSPSNCCILVNDDDLFSFAWISNNIPEDSLIGIAALGKPGNLQPSDGGAWVEYYTERPTRKLDVKENFIDIKWRLCRDNVTYFYLDSLENSFDEFNIIEAGGTQQLSFGEVRIYSLDCSFLE